MTFERAADHAAPERRIEDYAMIGDLQTAALVSRSGSIDWLCLPRFDSAACFAALLGAEENGHWSIAPQGGLVRSSRRYRGDTLVLETEHETRDGVVRVTDCMPQRSDRPDIVRVVDGVRGRVPMRMELKIRFDYGSATPWVRRTSSGLQAVTGPDGLRLWTDVELRGEDFTTLADFSIGQGERVPFSLTWYPSNEPAPPPLDPFWALRNAERTWADWASRCTYEGRWREAVLRSLITLKALTYAPTGGVAAAPTTSLPESPTGVRNWDYRFCWLRDATFTLYALLLGGYEAEARAWRDWLIRAIAGRPSQLQVVYGVAGERRLTEFELPHLSGFGGATPVRVGNSAHQQFQLDVYGEVADLLYQAAESGIEHEDQVWRVERGILEFLEGAWNEPDHGIWEVRGPARHFTHSKVMAWVAFDRAVRTVEALGLDGPVGRWKTIRDQIHGQVCAEAYDPSRNTFTQYRGSREVDASLLLIPLVGFLPAEDPRVGGTIEAVRDSLSRDGLLARCESSGDVEGVEGREGAFLACTFWLVDCLALSGRIEEARNLFARLLDLRNDVGLLSEEYDVEGHRMLGNFPQAFSHVSLIGSAHNLEPSGGGPAHRRGGIT